MDKHERWNERYAKKELTWSSGPNALLESLVAERPAGKALDIATGEGRNALWLASRGWGVDAIDFSSVGIEKGKSMAAERNLKVNWITADVCQRVFARAEYDLVAVVFLHTTADERNIWLPAVIDAVAPGGQFIYIAHDPSNVDHGIGGPQDRSLLPGVEDVCIELGDFEILRAEIYERQVGNDRGHGGPATGLARDSLISARRRAPD